MPRAVTVAAVCAFAVVLSACMSDSDPSGAPADRPTATHTTASASPTPSPTPTPTPSTSEPTSSPVPTRFDVAQAMVDVREIVGFGPRETTSNAYAQAADVVAERLTELGYDVSRQRFRVPAGESWGVPVEAGRTSNVVAHLPGVRQDEPHVVVGAHLDTVPQAPGAEDNASGVAVLLGLAALAADGSTRLPVTFVVFGAEEPRGPADDEHHFGSQEYVQERAGAELVAMVSLDRVSSPGAVPVCTGGLSPLRVQRQLIDAADRLGIPARACENRTSDHWPFEKAGETVARIGGNDYAAYHSAQDLPRVVDRRQLRRVGDVMWEWLRVVAD